MNYFVKLGDRLVVRFINYGILFHAMLCMTSLAMPFLVIFWVMSLVEDMKLTNLVLQQGEVVTVHLVNRSEERKDSHSGKYLYYLLEPGSGKRFGELDIGTAIPYLRSEPVGELEELTIYSHPTLLKRVYPQRLIIEVPEHPTWDSVFALIRGRSFYASIALLVLQFFLAMALVYVSVRGYFMIKYGFRKKRYR